MGRLHHLQRTIIPNLSNTVGDNCEFVILNYNSQDGMHEWVKQNLRWWIDRGIVKYYHTRQPRHFVAAHAKNIAHRQATGDILCNVDADNFIIEGFPQFLTGIFSSRPNCIVASPSLDIFGNTGCCGKISTRRDHFYNVNGYDEEMNEGWCWEDTNFQYRTRLMNNLDYFEVIPRFCRVLEHYDDERVKNFKNKNIFQTRQMGIDRTTRMAETKDYIANKNKNWGYVSDLSSDI